MATSASRRTKGITRIDQPGGHGVGWYARVTYQGKTWSKYFADKAHGGTRVARKKAVDWRDEKEKEVGKPATARVVNIGKARSQTGVTGVYRIRNHFVVAWSPKPGKLARQFVSITKYGEDGAFRRAVKLRREKEQEIYGFSVATTRGSRVSSSAAKPAATKARKATGAATKKRAAPARKSTTSVKKSTAKAAKKPAAAAGGAKKSRQSAPARHR